MKKLIELSSLSYRSWLCQDIKDLHFILGNLAIKKAIDNGFNGIDVGNDSMNLRIDMRL